MKFLHWTWVLIKWITEERDLLNWHEGYPGPCHRFVINSAWMNTLIKHRRSQVNCVVILEEGFQNRVTVQNTSLTGRHSPADLLNWLEGDHGPCHRSVINSASMNTLIKHRWSQVNCVVIMKEGFQNRVTVQITSPTAPASIQPPIIFIQWLMVKG